MGAKRKIRAALILAVSAIASAFVPAAATAAPVASAHTSVIGGKPTSIAEFPWLAYISGIDLFGDYSCTGTVVAPRVVLTAAHCVEDPDLADLTPTANFKVATGTANRLKVGKAQTSTVSRALVNPSFNLSWIHGDAALLILSAPVAAPPLPIATAADAGLLNAGTPVSIAGWGLIDVEDEDGPTLLRSGANLVQSAAYCKRHAGQTDPHYSPAVQLCALDTPGHAVSACFGDSGGPAIARRADGTPVQVGITSLGEPACNPASPTVFTRVDRLSAWISGWIATVETGAPPPSVRPRPLPPLEIWRAEEITDTVLDANFPGPSLLGENGISCLRVAKSKVKCEKWWRHGHTDYYGALTSFFAIQDGVPAIDYHYTVHWMSQRCRARSAHPATCPVHTRHR